jgi:hypothetical protein
MSKEEQIGKRFIDIMTKLEDLGVFYGKNYDGEYHEKYPHSSYWFQLDMDQHRGGFETQIMCDDCSFGITVGDGDNAIEQLLSVLEKSYNKITDELNPKTIKSHDIR